MSASALDIATNPEAMKILIYNEILIRPHMFDFILPPINDMDSPILFPEPEAKLNTNQLLPIDEHTDIQT